MSLLDKLGIGTANERPRGSRPVASAAKPQGKQAAPIVASAGSPRSPEPHVATRVSNGLKEFLWNLDGLGRGTLLDLGPAWQTTLNFFIERGFRVSSEDILRGWKGFLDEDEARLRADGALRESLDATPSGRASRFLEGNLKYPPASFDAIDR